MITEYKHWVFSASNESCGDVIKVALYTAKSLGWTFELENDVVECAYHSTIKVHDDGYNTCISLQNTDLYQLIDDCMRFAVELYLANERNGIKPSWIKK